MIRWVLVLSTLLSTLKVLSWSIKLQANAIFKSLAHLKILSVTISKTNSMTFQKCHWLHRTRPRKRHPLGSSPLATVQAGGARADGAGGGDFFVAAAEKQKSGLYEDEDECWGWRDHGWWCPFLTQLCLSFCNLWLLSLSHWTLEISTCFYLPGHRLWVKSKQGPFGAPLAALAEVFGWKALWMFGFWTTPTLLRMSTLINQTPWAMFLRMAPPSTYVRLARITTQTYLSIISADPCLQGGARPEKSF